MNTFFNYLLASQWICRWASALACRTHDVVPLVKCISIARHWLLVARYPACPGQWSSLWHTDWHPLTSAVHRKNSSFDNLIFAPTYYNVHWVYSHCADRPRVRLAPPLPYRACRIFFLIFYKWFASTRVRMMLQLIWHHFSPNCSSCRSAWWSEFTCYFQALHSHTTTRQSVCFALDGRKATESITAERNGKYTLFDSITRIVEVARVWVRTNTREHKLIVMATQVFSVLLCLADGQTYRHGGCRCSDKIGTKHKCYSPFKNGQTLLFSFWASKFMRMVNFVCCFTRTFRLFSSVRQENCICSARWTAR